MQDLPTTLATRRVIHPDDNRDGESSGASHLKPSKDPFKLKSRRARMREFAKSVNPDVTDADIDWLLGCLPESGLESLDKEIREANKQAIENGTFKMFRLNADGSKTDITHKEERK